MNSLLLTKDTSFIIGPIAQLLGYLMNGIFWVLDKIGLPNIGLSIIFFTLIIYLIMLPLTYRQQKFSKLSQRMQPELNAIQKKYKDKKDEASQQKMNEETQALYKKYGISPMGSCVQLLIQMPILFALYRVIYNIPAYVTQVKNAFFPLVTDLMDQTGAAEYLQETSAGANFTSRFTSDDYLNNVGDTVSNVFIDVLNRFSTTEWMELADEFSNLSEEIETTLSELTQYNNFLGLNIANSPWYTFQNAIAAGSILAIIGAVSVPALAALTQIINVALTPQQKSTGDAQQDQMQSSMKTMNILMPIMSAWFCFTLPAGMGLYWIAGAVIRSIQQVILNRYFDNIDMENLIEKQREKAEKKAERRGQKKEDPNNVTSYSNLSTRNDPQALTRKRTLAEKADYNNRVTKNSYETPETTAEVKHYRKDSLTARANMVAEFNHVERSSGGSATGRVSRINREKAEKQNSGSQTASENEKSSD